MAVDSLFNRDDSEPKEDGNEQDETSIDLSNKKLNKKNESRNKRKRKQLLEKIKVIKNGCVEKKNFILFFLS